MGTLRRRAGLPMLLAFEWAAVVALHRLGRLEWVRVPWSELGTWLDTAPVEDVLAAVLRLVAIVIAYWLLGTTVLYLLARVTHVPAALRSVEWATISTVRRVVDRAVAVSIVSAAFAGPVLPALAESPSPIVVEVDEQGRPVPPGLPSDGRPDTTVHPAEERAPTVSPAGLDRIGWTPTPAGSEAGRSRPSGGMLHRPRIALATEQVSRPASPPASVVVERGDHLWSISRRHLEAVGGAEVSNDRVAVYWRRVMDANQDRLRSGNVDLIFPGETVELPPIEMEDE